MRTLTEPPTMIIVAATESRCDAESIERSMIRDLLEEGADLTNESRPAPVGGLLPPTTIGDHPLVGMEITTKTRRADLARVVRLAQRWM